MRSGIDAPSWFGVREISHHPTGSPEVQLFKPCDVVKSMGEKFRTALTIMTREGKKVTYSLVRCQSLTECLKKIESTLKSSSINFMRLVDPDCYSLVSTVEGYSSTGFSILEARGPLNRAFYVVPSPELPSFNELGEEFRIKFRVKKQEVVPLLVRYICQGKIRKRHAHSSTINFILSMIAGLASPLFTGEMSFLAQIIVMAAFAFGLFFLLEYPLSLLHLKGVDIVKEENIKARVVLIKFEKRS